VCRLVTLRECQAAEASAAFLKALKKGRAATVYHALYQPCEAPALLAAAQDAAQQWVPPQLLWGRGKLLYSRIVHVPATCSLLSGCALCINLSLGVACLVKRTSLHGCRNAAAIKQGVCLGVCAAVKWQQYGLQFRDFFSCDDTTGTACLQVVMPQEWRKD
jgi:hypothetical protein